MTWPIVRSVGPAGGFINTVCWWSSVLLQETGLTEPRAAPEHQAGLGADGLGTHLGLETTMLKFLFVPGLPGASPPPPRAGVRGFEQHGGQSGRSPGKRPHPGRLVSPPALAPRHPSPALQAQQQPGVLSSLQAQPSRLSRRLPCLPSTAGPPPPQPSPPGVRAPCLPATPARPSRLSCSLKPSWAAPSPLKWPLLRHGRLRSRKDTRSNAVLGFRVTPVFTKIGPKMLLLAYSMLL